MTDSARIATYHRCSTLDQDPALARHEPRQAACRLGQLVMALTGDACHTRWGWEHDVEPGTFSSDVPRSAESLARLRRLVAEHPGVEVRLGHQR